MSTTPPLITTEGLVLNNMFEGGALGGYTPPGTASSEGISLMLRGVVRAAIATGDSQKISFAKFLFDSACEIFFKGVRPTSVAGQEWHHSWIANGGAAFSVRGPLDSSGDLALSGYLYGRNDESTVSFTNGVGQINPPPDIVYQAVTADAEFVWDNMFSDLTRGAHVEVEYYIDSKGNKVFGTQRGGSFGQPIIPAGEHSDGNPGKIKLVSPLTGSLGVNFCVTVPGVSVAYAELYEAWPMWRRLAEEEVSSAGDAFHWFLDAFRLGMEMEPSNPDWKNAHDRMLEVWELTCKQESNSTRIFQASPNGPYNNFPLTYGYAYGQSNVDNPATNWDVIPPTNKYTAERTIDGYVTFTFPAENAQPGSGESIRYGAAFENSPLFLEYTEATSLSIDMRSSITQVIQTRITSKEGDSFEASVLVGPSSNAQLIGMDQFLKFQQEPGDATGDQTGDWSGEETEEPWDPPVYSAVPFPGRRTALVGDSITWMNNFWNPPVGTPGPWDEVSDSGWGAGGGSGGQDPNAIGYYEYFGNGMCGYFNYANMIMGQRLSLEPAIEDRQATEKALGQPVGRYKNGNNFAIAGSRTDRWELAQDNTLNDGVLEVGPMYNARRYLNQFDLVVMMGGTNDLAGAEVTAQAVFHNLRRFAYEFAAAGKWVFLQTVTPRTVEWLGGYYSPAGDGWMGDPETANPNDAFTRSKQELVRDRIEQVNQMLRDWIAEDNPPNIWLVDTFADLVGPNGRDPFGAQSHETNPLAAAAKGNYRADLPNLICMYDGLHPGPAGAYVMGKKLAQVMIAAGVPARGVGAAWPYSIGPNIIGNASFAVTTTRPADEGGFSSVHGRAIGLGPAKADATHPYWTGEGSMPADYNYRQNLGIGYEYGQVPDYWQFYRSKSNWINEDDAEGWSNFNEYTWESLSEEYPVLLDYMNDSTWSDGAITTDIITDGGVRTMRIQVNLPQTGNKNESFVFRTLVPRGQHGKWDEYGYADFDWDAWFQTNTQPPTQDDVNTVPNTLYSTNDLLYAEGTVKMSNVTNMYTWRMGMNFLCIDSSAVTLGDVSTAGAKISTFANSQNFWPPSLIGNIGMVPTPDTLTYRTPAVRAPIVKSEENQVYAQLNYEFAFDCSQGPATATILIKNPGVYKIIGGV